MNKKTNNVKCFVCGQTFDKKATTVNPEVLMSVCKQCKGSNKEKEQVRTQIESLSDGWFCGGM